MRQAYWSNASMVLSYSNNRTRESFRQIGTSFRILDDFFCNRQEHYFQKLLCKGQMIAFCRSKMAFSRKQDKEMYDYVCMLIDKYKSKDYGKLPLKYKQIIGVRTYGIFTCMMKLFK